MAGYRFSTVVDVDSMKDTIVEMWEEYLPRTCHKRFDWMNVGNPAGKTIWLFSYSEKIGDLAGIMSIMPRIMFCSGKILRAGIMGDLMVPKRFRAFGPGLLMPKYIVSNYKSLGFDLLYTVPNSESKKVEENARINFDVPVKSLIRPINVYKYLKKYMLPTFAKATGFCIDIALKSVSLNTYAIGGVAAHEEILIDDSFDEFWVNIIKNHSGIIGDRSSQWLQWRYFKNPQFAFRMLSLKKTEKLLGYLFFTIENDIFNIFDLMATDEWCSLKLLNKAAFIAREEECKAIYMYLNTQHPRFTTCKRNFFMDARQDFSLMIHAEPEILSERWLFTNGDRNL